MILIFIAVCLLLLAVVALFLTKDKRALPDYYTFFILGLVWLPIGLAAGNLVLLGMGLIFAVVGLVNKDKWKKNRQDWRKLGRSEKRRRLVIIATLGVLILAGIVLWILANRGVLSF